MPSYRFLRRVLAPQLTFELVGACSCGRRSTSCACYSKLVSQLATDIPLSPCLSFSPRTLQYADDESVVLWLSKVGPYHNPQETYSYYALPFCKPAKKLTPETRIGGLGEILEGNDLVNSDVPLHFRKDVSHASVCSMKLDADGAKLLQFAVSNHYWYQMFVDELPVWGMVGEIVADEDAIEEIESHLDRPHGIAESTFLYTHKNLCVPRHALRFASTTAAVAASTCAPHASPPPLPPLPPHAALQHDLVQRGADHRGQHDVRGGRPN